MMYIIICMSQLAARALPRLGDRWRVEVGGEWAGGRRVMDDGKGE